ncbi:MAG: hypothetical protein US99_C0074G0004 [Candidatus Daviesbacteria bacterium GW2011_GWF2_38_6]|uniref:Uncharacterized protein n=1 Tax=Candidatus Daviesbacteria bacterium GW2011_GWF2_38_6 TaxID=1618432 RepID=A0A0G0KBZ1_9BACT|nr:MAG: hypothetical protein US99_C0074G0004 [Candidatus Daviesbacteria bacterium GW2011_GWF2_38_6]
MLVYGRIYRSMKQIILVLLAIITVISLIVTTFTIDQVGREDQRLKSDLQYRSTLLAESLKETVEPNFINKSEDYLQNVVERFTDTERFAGLGIYDNKGKAIAISSVIPEATSAAQEVIANAMDADKANGDFAKFQDKKVYLLAVPLHDEKSVVGALMIVQNAGYIDSRLTEIWKNNLVRLLVQASLYLQTN